MRRAAYCVVATALSLAHAVPAQVPLRATTTERIRWGHSGDPELARIVVVNAAFMTDSSIALLVAAPNKREIVVRSLDGSIRDRWDLPPAEYPTELVAHGDSLNVILGQYEDARLVTFVVGQRKALREQPLTVPRGRVPFLRGKSGAGAVLLWTPETPLSRPIPPAYRPRFLVGADPMSAYSIDEARSRVNFTVPQDPRQAVLSVSPPWEGSAVIDAIDGVVYFARPVAGIIERYEANAKRPDSVVIRAQRSDISDGDGSKWHSEWVKLLESTTYFPDSVADLARSVPPPTVRPLMRALHVATPTDMIIVRADQGPRLGLATSVIVDGVNAEGEVTFRVELPAGASVLDYDGARLLVRLPDPSRQIQVRREGRPEAVHQLAILELNR